MAERKTRPHPTSIVAIAGQSIVDAATEEESKAEQYRRLKARKALETGETAKSASDETPEAS
jgi:hypothetical protein